MADGEKKGKKVAEEDDSDDSDDSDSDSDGGFEVDEAFKNELLAALEAGGMGVPAGISKEDGESSDEEDEVSPVAKNGESEEEEILDDDAMLELDERLADIFRANGGGRRSKKRASILRSLLFFSPYC
jgi:DNA polymerase phi